MVHALISFQVQESRLVNISIMPEEVKHRNSLFIVTVSCHILVIWCDSPEIRISFHFFFRGIFKLFLIKGQLILVKDDPAQLLRTLFDDFIARVQ